MSHSPRWLSRYARNYHAWTINPSSEQNHRKILSRPLGIVEHSFDIDGTDFEGRADVSSRLTLEVSSTLNDKSLRERVLLAWAVLRACHACLRLNVTNGEAEDGQRRFCVEWPLSEIELVAEAEESIVFVAERIKAEVDADMFWTHAMNCSRVLDTHNILAKMFVFSPEPKVDGGFVLDVLFIAGHEITDGLTNLNWMSHFTALLNHPIAHLRKALNTSVDLETYMATLPKAQEDLYPLRAGNEKWAWAITRILRHVRRPPPIAFQNPLRREHSLTNARPMPNTFLGVLDYSRTPPLNSFTTSVILSTPATARVKSLCHEAGVSVGAGAFALVAMSLMVLHEQRYPDIPEHARLPFVGHFPVNPRPFFGHTAPADSLMLAFSDGLTLPFLSSSLPLEPRFRLLARQAHRQLRVYQKRPRSTHAIAEMGSRSPSQLLPSNYLAMIERLYTKMPGSVTMMNPQGEYPATVPLGPGTCGVSSIGSLKGLVPDRRFPVVRDEDSNGEFAANWVGLTSGVRARDNEFLVGSMGDDFGLHFTVSYDGNAIDEGRVNEWKKVIAGLLETQNYETEGELSLKGKL